MRWRGRRQSSNIKDLRGSGARGSSARHRSGRGGGIRIGGRRTRQASGGGIGFIVVILIVSWFLGVNPLTLLDGQLEPGMITGQNEVQQNAPLGAGDDEASQFVATVLADTEAIWGKIFASAESAYPEPTLVLFSNRVQSACGFASAASGPFYCPGDQQIYIDLSFFDELKRKFGAPGDFAQAYVIAHEVGHHVQQVTGILPRVNEQRRRLSQVEANAMSVRVELQADCLAGIWGHYTEKYGYLEHGDLGEALNAARQIGDDAIQQRTRGYTVPESFSHGTSEQRKHWFERGFETGRFEACDTFSVSSL